MVNPEIGVGRVVAAIHRAQLEPGDSGRPTADGAVAVLVDIMGAAMLVAMLAATVTASVFSGSSTTLLGSDAAALVANR